MQWLNDQAGGLPCGAVVSRETSANAPL